MSVHSSVFYYCPFYREAGVRLQANAEVPSSNNTRADVQEQGTKVKKRKKMKTSHALPNVSLPVPLITL